MVWGEKLRPDGTVNLDSTDVRIKRELVDLVTNWMDWRLSERGTSRW